VHARSDGRHLRKAAQAGGRAFLGNWPCVASVGDRARTRLIFGSKAAAATVARSRQRQRRYIAFVVFCQLRYRLTLYWVVLGEASTDRRVTYHLTGYSRHDYEGSRILCELSLSEELAEAARIPKEGGA
jgi:hypothetical protein